MTTGGQDRDVLSENRGGQKPIPDNVTDLLTDMQRIALMRIQNFGWRLKFVRRPLFQVPTVVVENANGLEIGVLEENGEVNLKPDLVLRESA